MNKNIIIKILIFIIMVMIGFGGYYYFFETKNVPVYEKNADEEESNEWDYNKNLSDNDGSIYTLRVKNDTDSAKYEVVDAQGLVILSKIMEFVENSEETSKIHPNAFEMKIHNFSSLNNNIKYLAIEYNSAKTHFQHEYEIFSIENNKATKIVNIGLGGTSYVSATADNFLNYIIEDNSVSFFYGSGCNEDLENKISSSSITKELGEILYLKLTLSENDYTIEKLSNPYPDIEGAGAKC